MEGREGAEARWKKKEKKKPAGLRSNIYQRQCEFGVFFILVHI